MGETVDFADQQLDRHRRTTGFGPIRSGCCHPSRAIACGCLTPALRREHQGRSPASATVEARRQCRTRILILMDEHHINVINAATGEVLRDFTFDPTRDYQPTGAPKGPERKNRGPKVGPRLFRCLATSPSSGDRIRTCDLWVMRQKSGVSGYPPFPICGAQSGCAVRAAPSDCICFGLFRTVLFPNVFPNLGSAADVDPCRVAIARPIAPVGW